MPEEKVFELNDPIQAPRAFFFDTNALSLDAICNKRSTGFFTGVQRVLE